MGKMALLPMPSPWRRLISSLILQQSLPVRRVADNSEDGCSDECVSARIETGAFVAVKIFFSTSCAVPVALAVVSLAGSNRAADTEPQKEH